MSEGTNRNIDARNTPVQLLALYTNPESHNAQRYRETDRQTDGRHNDANRLADHTEDCIKSHVNLNYRENEITTIVL